MSIFSFERRSLSGPKQPKVHFVLVLCHIILFVICGVACSEHRIVARRPRLVMELEPGPVEHATFSPDGQVIALLSSAHRIEWRSSDQLSLLRYAEATDIFEGPNQTNLLSRDSDVEAQSLT